MDQKVNILLPVETINRELDSRLFLACLFATENNRIFVGQHDAIYHLLQHMQGGVYVGKNIFRALFPDTDLSRYHTLKKNQLTLVYLDEEGGVYAGDEENWRHYLKILLDPGCLSDDDYICTWGDFQKAFHQSLHPRCISNIHTTGHPRFDLYKPNYREYFAADAARLQARFGDFILINTNLSLANNAFGLADSFSMRLNYNVTHQKHRTNHIHFWAHSAQILSNFVKLINRLSIEFPNYNIVIRPHPTEDEKFYSTIFKGIENIHIVHEGPVGPWLFACKLLIHDGCTTGIEAYLADTSLINYKSVVDEKQDLFLPNIFGIKCFTEDDVVAQAHAILQAAEQVTPAGECNEIAYSLLDNFMHDSFKKLMNVMAEAEERQRCIPQSFASYKHQVEEILRGTTAKAKSLVRPLFPTKQHHYRVFKSHFYGFNQTNIESKLQTIQEIINKPIRYKKYSDSLILIEKG